MRKLIALAVLSAMGLAGCGSDSDSTPPPSAPEQPTPAPQYANLDVHVEPNSQFDGFIRVYLGRWYPCTTEHPEMCDPAMPADYELPTTGSVTGSYGKNPHDKLYNARTSNDSKYYMEIAASDIKAWREQSIRDDIFVPGHYSILDVMLYVSTQRNDLEVTLGEWNDELNTYDYSVSFDADGDGRFDNAAAGDYQNSENWSASFVYSQGDNLKRGNPFFDTIYDRLDEFLVRPDMHLRIQPVTPAMRERIKLSQKAQTDRLKANGGKVVVPMMVADFDDGRGFQTLATDIEVKAYNLRPDIYQPGVITVMDVFMTAWEQHGIDLRFSYWPTLSTGARVEGYILSELEGTVEGEGSMSGWGWMSGEAQTLLDFFNGKQWPNAQELVNGTYVSSAHAASGVPICHFLRDEQGQLDDVTAQECIDHWFSGYGANLLHNTADVAVMMNPKELFNVLWLTAEANKRYEMTELNAYDDGKFPIYDIDQAVAPLQSSHFGWGIADCGLCHGKENTHLDGGDSPVLPNNTEPYFCASCHGSNGAPVGHGKITRCFFCHSKDQLMLNHGEASQQFRYDEVQCDGVTKRGNDVSGHTAPCADVVKDMDDTAKQMVDSSHNSAYYKDLPISEQLTRGNNAWRTSETFPDPYSCMTCHPNK